VVIFHGFSLFLQTNINIQFREIMINRVLIRLKAVQLVYAFYQNGSNNLDAAEKELFFSLSKAYDLYKYLLLLMAEITRFGRHNVAQLEQRAVNTHSGETYSHKFIDNRFIAQLEKNKQLIEFQETQKKNWIGEEAFIRSMYKRIISSDIYQEYMASEENSYEADREVWRKLYKNIFYNNEELEGVLENMSLYWNDDKFIVDTFVHKTIKRFEEANGEDQELLPEYKADEDKEYARALFRNAIENDGTYRDIIAAHSRNWEFNRIAFMDMIIMQLAISEILTFPNIPVNVTINEFVEIAKFYSTRKSGMFVNGMLDAIGKSLREQGQINKN